jgi:hypothetical protein
LRIDVAVAEPHQRRVVRDRARRDDHACSVRGSVPRQTFDPHRGIEQLSGLRSGLINKCQFRYRIDGLPNGNRTGRNIGDELGDAVHVCKRHSHHAAHVAHRGTSCHGPKRHDLRHSVRTVLLCDVLDDFAAALETKIRVDVRHRDTVGVQEPFEEKVVTKRIDVCDAQRVCNEAPCRGSSPGANRDALLARVSNEIPHDEKVRSISHAVDDVQLVFDPLEVLGLRLSVALAQSFEAKLSQKRLVVARIRGDRKRRQSEGLRFQIDVDHIGDRERGVARVG